MFSWWITLKNTYFKCPEQGQEGIYIINRNVNSNASIIMTDFGLLYFLHFETYCKCIFFWQWNKRMLQMWQWFNLWFNLLWSLLTINVIEHWGKRLPMKFRFGEKFLKWKFSAPFLFLCMCLLMCSNNSLGNMWKTC